MPSIRTRWARPSGREGDAGLLPRKPLGIGKPANEDMGIQQSPRRQAKLLVLAKSVPQTGSVEFDDISDDSDLADPGALG
jgi:hypothetical protein